jgi:Uma2 family endonuclease
MFPAPVVAQPPPVFQPGRKTYTVDDYLAVPDEYPRYELLEGEMIEMVSPTSRHQRVLFRLSGLLDVYCRAHQLGEVFIAPLDVILSRTVVVQPDIFFIAQSRRAALVGDRITGAPDLLIEILSPSTGARDLNQKRKLYARAGVAEYWIVDPDDATIEIQRLQGKVLSTHALFGAGETLTSPLLAGLSLTLDEVFAA